uniref:Uncharacterized protein n=1 Tax=Salix viminalis TaxID=40686 RepID=A0A6N2MKS1_SALVM
MKQTSHLHCSPSLSELSSVMQIIDKHKDCFYFFLFQLHIWPLAIYQRTPPIPRIRCHCHGKHIVKLKVNDLLKAERDSRPGLHKPK